MISVVVNIHHASVNSDIVNEPGSSPNWLEPLVMCDLLK
jgi:hypothetical protein